MASAVSCACVALGVILLTVVTNSLRPLERRIMSIELLLQLSGVAALNLLVCLAYSWWNTTKSTSAAPRVLVVGCGAVGSVVGFHLARGGAQVAFLVREDRAERLDGLRLERLGLCTCSKGRAAIIKQVEWVGFDVFTNVTDCCGPVRLRSDSPNTQAKPFDVVVMAISAASTRAAAPALKQLVEGLGKNCAVVRVVSELGEDHFFENTLSVHHTTLIDLGIGFMSYVLPLENCGRSAVGETFAYSITSSMLLSSISSTSGDETGNSMIPRLAECFNHGELPCRRVPSVGAALAVPSAALLGLVVNLEHSGWKFAALRDDAARQGQLSRSLGEALDIVTSDNEGQRRRHNQGYCRCRSRLIRMLLTSRCILRLALWFVTCTHCSFLTRNLIFPFDVERFLSQHFSKLGVAAQTRVFLGAYIAAGQERKLPVDGLRNLAAALPKLPALRGSEGYGASGFSVRSTSPSMRADPPSAGKKKLRVGKLGETSATVGAGSRFLADEDQGLNPGDGDFARGCTVVLMNLKAATHHNGKVGIIDGFIEEKSSRGRGRVVVKLSGTGEKLSVKPENLSIRPATPV